MFQAKSLVAHRAASPLLHIALSLAAGCGAPATAGADAGVTHMKVVGLLYGQFMSTHGGVPPASEQQFTAFLEREPANWNKLAGSVTELLKSPRTGQPLTVVYGSTLPKAPTDGGLPIIAYEQAGVDGKHLAVNLRGGVEMMESAAVDQLSSRK